MGIINRTVFEQQLSSYFDDSLGDVDMAWHALRYAICAAGCRINLSETHSVQDANETAWAYFENALALHSQILLFKTTLINVQALTVMVCHVYYYICSCSTYPSQAYFCQNFGSPCLEYMLCNNALSLALGKGLHRKPTQGWNLTPAEHSLRSCLFWALYCLEKQIEKQSGRPSVSNVILIAQG